MARWYTCRGPGVHANPSIVPFGDQTTRHPPVKTGGRPNPFRICGKERLRQTLKLCVVEVGLSRPRTETNRGDRRNLIDISTTGRGAPPLAKVPLIGVGLVVAVCSLFGHLGSWAFRRATAITLIGGSPQHGEPPAGLCAGGPVSPLRCLGGKHECS